MDLLDQERKRRKPTLGKQCAAWGCSNRGLIEKEGARVSSGISFFTFPKDPGLKNVWCNRIKRVDGKDNFRVTSHTVLCEKHFSPNDIIKPFGGTKRRLKEGSKPLLFERMVVEEVGRRRKAPILRSSPRKKMSIAENIVQESSNDDIDHIDDQEYVSFAENADVEEAKEKANPTLYTEDEYKQLQEENSRLKAEILHMQSPKYIKCNFIDHVISSPDTCNHYTGFPNMDVFRIVYDFLDPGVTGENILLYNNQQRKGCSSGRPRLLSPLESFILTFVRVRRNFDVAHMSYLFQVSEATVTNTFFLSHCYHHTRSLSMTIGISVS